MPVLNHRKALGVKGAIGSTYNFAAPLYTTMIEAFNSGDFEKARDLQHQSMILVELLGSTGGSFFAACKAVMKMIGIDCGPVRPPLRNLTSEKYKKLESELNLLGFFDFCSK